MGSYDEVLPFRDLLRRRDCASSSRDRTRNMDQIRVAVRLVRRLRVRRTRAEGR
jgi:hypothetical protein